MRYDGNNLDELATLYDNTMVDILDSHAPLLKKTVRSIERKNWYTSELRQLKKEKRIAEQVWKKSRLRDDFAIFTEKRNKYINMCERLKIEFYHLQVDKCEGDSMKLFKLITCWTDGTKENPLIALIRLSDRSNK